MRGRAIRLRQAIPVYLLYWTAGVDVDGALQTRPDVYDRDAALITALGHPEPAQE